MNVATLTLNPAVDVGTRIERVEPNRKLRCAPPRHDPGGGGINVAAVLAELGCNAVAVFPWSGSTGEQLVELVRRRGIECRPVETGGLTRRNLSVREESSGRQYRFLLPGTKLEPDAASMCLAEVWQIDPPPDFLVLSGSFPPGLPGDFMQRVVHECRNRDVRLVVDVSGEPLRIAADEGVFLLKPNRRELAELSGDNTESAEKQEKELARLVGPGRSKVAVLSLGGKGIRFATAEGIEFLEAPEVEVNSRVGAGDSMVGGIVAGLCRGLSMREAIRLGLAAGSAAVMTSGTELCRRDDVERLFEKTRHAGGQAPGS